MDWIKTDKKLPEKGTRVLGWYGDPAYNYDIAFIDDEGSWAGALSGNRTGPSHWMPLPQPPGEDDGIISLADIKGDIAEDRLMLDIDKEKETVAALMQYFINGSVAVVNGMDYFVIDMKNEIIGGKMMSVFYLKHAE